jgi:CRISPR-associated protein Csd1
MPGAGSGAMILGALANYYDRLVEDRERSKIPPIGYSYEQISYALVLTPEGVPLRLEPHLDTSGKTPRPKRLAVPLTERTSGVRAKFLWDNTSYVFGQSARSKRTAEEHADFKKRHETLLAGETDQGLCAVFQFLTGWAPERYAEIPGHVEALDATLVFRLDGERNFIHERAAAMCIWDREFGKDNLMPGVCLMTGEDTNIAKLHPSIKGVRDAQTSGAYVVSFNADAFTSYGKGSGDNAPVSAEKVYAYTLTLNYLLRGGEGNRNKVQIADATTVFWAEAGKPEQRSFAEAWGHAALSGVKLDEAERIVIEPIMQKLARGMPLGEIDPRFKSADTKFYVLGLSPNAARIAVRFWQAGTFEHFAESFRRHFLDLRMLPEPWKRPPSVWRLLLETAPQRKSENIASTLGGAVMRSVLSGLPYPRTLFGQILMRLRADHDVNGMRAAILKACIVRKMREIDKIEVREDYLVSLNREEINPAYRLGRLFAVLEGAQRAALGNINATIRDRFYGAASATPAAVFPILIRNATHHIAGLRKGKSADWVKDPARSAFWFDKEIASILEVFGKDFPRSFPIEEQGRFAIGYYHQRFTKAADAPADVQKIAGDAIAGENETEKE